MDLVYGVSDEENLVTEWQGNSFYFKASLV